MSFFLKHVLIADDDPDDVFMFQSALDELCPDLKLSVASNGIELISLLNKVERPDAIVLDLNMPCKDGKQCLVEIRTMALFKNIPIVMLSTSSSKVDIDYCLTNGANKYIVKPQSFEGLKAVVEVLCNGELGMIA